MIVGVLLACMVDVHLEGQEREIEFASDKCEGFGHILLMELRCFLPTTGTECFLKVFRLQNLVSLSV